MSASDATVAGVDAEAAAKAAAKAIAKRKAQRRAAFLRQMVQWHWISAAICLVGMILFAVTGITLNHAGAIPADPKTITREGQLPAPLITAAKAAETAEATLPAPIAAWLGKEMDIKAKAGSTIEWSEGEAYVALPRPGGDAWVTLDTETGAVAYERTDRGAISFLNDLHKGRNTGKAWSLFLDAFAIAVVVFCVTGFALLFLHSHARKSTWPLIGLGLVAPLLLILLFIH